MSHSDDYAPRSQRDRPRYDADAGPRYADHREHADTRKPGASRPRYKESPPPYGLDDSRRRKEVDPRDIEASKTYHDYYSGRDGDLKTTKPNTTAARRRSPLQGDDQDPALGRHRDRDLGYGRSHGYREPIPRLDSYARERDATKPRRRDDHDDFEPAPPRRAHTQREPDRRRRVDLYDEGARRRARSPEDRYSDPDQSYPRRRRGDDRYDDRQYRSGGHSRRDEGYASERGHRRSARDRDRDRDRYYRDGDRDRDRRHNDSRDWSRDRDRDGRNKKKGFSIDDIGGLVEQGQKHYKTVAPLVTSLAKMYLDNKK